MSNPRLEKMKNRYRRDDSREYTIEEYLEICKNDRSAYASPAERMLLAMGEPIVEDTRLDSRKSRIFQNKVIRTYSAFKDFYGAEEIVESLVGYFKRSAQGLEESKQILYLLGPVGGGKSSVAEKLKSLMEKFPFYVLKAPKHEITLPDGTTEMREEEISPVNDSPLGLFSGKDDDDITTLSEYGIWPQYLNTFPSPWAMKRIEEFGDEYLTKFRVVKRYPSYFKRVAIDQTTPGDENNQDISALVGKVDIRKLEKYAQDDPDAYSYSGGLCHANRGMLDYVEMFKSPPKVLYPLLTATQEGSYQGTEQIGAIPFQGIIVAHSNESEWEQFKSNKSNEAFMDRVYIVKVPYCLRVTEETKIYEKLLRGSELCNSPCAPMTKKMLAQYVVLSRLKKPLDNGNIFSKLRVYDGENLKDTDPHAKSLKEYKVVAGVDEGMTGLSTRFAFKILSKVFNYDPTEIGANPVYLINVLAEVLPHEFTGEVLEDQKTVIVKHLTEPYMDFIGKEIQSAYIETYGDFGQNVFDNYITYADFWIQDTEYRDPETGAQLNRKDLNEELEKIEKPAGIANPKDFRNDIVNYVLRYRASHDNKNPPWASYEKLKVVIEKKMFSNLEKLLPAIKFDAKRSGKDKEEFEGFVARMMEKGYATQKTVRILCDWYGRAVKKS